MSTLLLDASVWLAALDAGDRFHESSIDLIDLSDQGRVTLAALDLTGYETTNVAVTKWHDGAAARALVDLIDSYCAGSILAVSGDLLRQAVRLAAAEEITVYDAAYPAAAKLNGWSLVSCDLRDLIGKRFAIDPASAAAEASS